MTCVWDSILHALCSHGLLSVMSVTARPSPIQLVNWLKGSNRKTPGVQWNGDSLTAKQHDENFEHVQSFQGGTIAGGYDCAACEPFLFLVCELFRVNIDHNYCGHVMQYRITGQVPLLRFRSNGGHMCVA
jgi:hypothetical protein